jgi:hypothetical protein
MKIRDRRIECTLTLTLVLSLFGVAESDVEESWSERSSGGKGGSSTSAAPAVQTARPKPPAGTAAPTTVPTRKPTTRATPDPKKLSKADFACRMVNAAADEAIANIEAKRAKNDSANPTQLDHVYDDAYKAAMEDLKQNRPGATQAELDAAGKKAARDVVRDAFTNGKITMVTGESFPDFFRRQSEGANRGTPVPPPSNALPARMSDYMKECAKEGVPLPPPWGDPRWVQQGSLPPGKATGVGEGNFPFVDVFVSKTPQGVCFALPRRDTAGGKIELLDQICQNEKTGKACFWDNSDPRDGDTALPVKDGLDPADIAGGDKLKRNCTKCHRGDNAFIIRTGTPLQLGPSNPCEKADPGSRFGQTDSDKRFQPIGRKTMPKAGDPEDRPEFANPSEKENFADLGDGPCSACHSIPKLNNSYCNFVLRPMIINGDMPPKGSPETKKPAEYQKDIKALTDACKKIEDASLQNGPSDDAPNPLPGL